MYIYIYYILYFQTTSFADLKTKNNNNIKYHNEFKKLK